MNVDKRSYVEGLTVGDLAEASKRLTSDSFNKNREGHMAEEKSRDTNQPGQPGNEKAQGAAVGAGAQGQQGQGQYGDRQKEPESSGQGGGVQGTGQRQPSQGQKEQGGKNQPGSMRDQSSRGGQDSSPDDDDF
jgi:hypothetical protein